MKIDIWLSIKKNLLGNFIFLWAAYNLILYVHYRHTTAGFLLGILFGLGYFLFHLLNRKKPLLDFKKYNLNITLKSWHLLLIFYAVSFLWANFSLFCFSSEILPRLLFYEKNLIINIASILLFYSLFILFVAGFGKKLLSLFKNDFKGIKNIFPISVALGLVPIMFGVFMLSLFKLVYPVIIIIFISLLSILARHEIKYFFIKIKNFRFRKNLNNKKDFTFTLILFSTFIFLAIAFTNTIKPLPGADDVDSLHSYYNVPNLISENHKYVILPNVNSANMGQNTEMIYTAIISTLGAKYIVHFSLIFFILFLMIAYNASLNLFGRDHANLSLLTLFYVPWNFYFTTTNKTDIFLSFYLISILYLFFKWQKNIKNFKYLYLIGILSGVSFGIKYNALFLLIPIYFLIFYFWIKNLKIVKFKNIFLSAFLVLVFASPWLIKNTYYFKNPVFPYFIDSPSSDIQAACDKTFKNQRMADVSLLKWSNNDNGISGTLSSMWRQSVGKNYTNYNFFNFGLFAFILFPFYFFHKKNKNLSILLFIIVIYFVLYLLTPTRGRVWYGMLGVSLLYLMLPYLLLKYRSLKILFLIFISIAVFHNFTFINTNILYATGKLNSNEFSQKTNPIFLLSQELNKKIIDENNKVLLLLDYRIGYIKNNDKGAVVDNYFSKTGCLLTNSDNYYDFLLKNNINFIVYSEAREGYTRSWVEGKKYTANSNFPSIYNDIDNFKDFLASYTDEIYNNNGYKIFEVKK